MKTNRLFTLALLSSAIVSCGPSVKVSNVFADAEKQTRLMLQEVPKAPTTSEEQFSPRTIQNGQLRLVASRDWTSGFFPGVLWFLNEYTGNGEWKTQAESFTAKMEREKTNATTHDMGFKVYCSYGTGYRLTNNPAYREIIIQSAKNAFNKVQTDHWLYAVLGS